MPPALKQVDKRQIIKDQICDWIREQGLCPGQKILSQNRLAAYFRVTPLTVHRALAELQDEGVLERKQGRGTFVRRVPAPASESALQDVCVVLPDQGLDRPERNPHAWPYVQRLFRVFLECLEDRGTFSTAKAVPGRVDAETVRRLQRYDTVFFLGMDLYADLIRKVAGVQHPRLVVIGPRLPDVACLTVEQDRVEGVRRGVRCLIDLGHRCIAYVGSSDDVGRLSYEGYTAALAAAGLAPPASGVFRGRDPEAAVEGLTGAARGCDAVFIDSDLVALSVIDLLRQRGVRVPEGLSVMGYDGLDNAVRQPPYLTSVRVPYREMIEYALAQSAAAGGGEPPHAAFAGDVLPGRTCRQREGG